MADLQRALEIAVEGHKGQTQKNGLPYVLHPLKVMSSVNSVEAKISAVLHDVVEDTPWTLEQLQDEGFSGSVLDAIQCLTHNDSEDYEAYIDRIAENSIAREVKMADLQDNMNIRRIETLKQKDLDRLEKYHRAWFKLGGKLA